MRVLYIVQFYAPPEADNGLRHWWATNALKLAGWEVHVVTGPSFMYPFADSGGRFPKVIDFDGIMAYVVDSPYKQTMKGLRRYASYGGFMLGALQRVFTMVPRPDVVFASSPPLSVGIPGMALSWVKGIPLVFEVADLWPDIPIELGFVKNGLLKDFFYSVERLLYRRASGIIAMSPGVKDVIVRRKGIRAAGVEVIPNVSDNDFFSPHVDGCGFRKKHGLSGKFVCAHTGSMGFVNGVGAILDVAALLKNRCPEVVFLLVGGGNERSELEQRAKSDGLSNIVFAGPLPKKEMPECVAAIDLGLMTVRSFKILEHNSANKFFDYLAAGKPVLLNYGGWQAKWLDRYDAGVSAPADDSQAMAEAVAEFARSGEKTRAMGGNARRLAKEQFDRDRHMVRFEQVIRRAAFGDEAPVVEPWPFSVGGGS